MDKIIRPCNPVQGAAYGQTPTLDLAIGPRYHRIWIEAIATAAVAQTLTLADVLGLVKLRINGKVHREHTAKELDAIYAGYGPGFGVNAYNFDGDVLTYVAGVPQGPQAAKKTIFEVPLYLNEPWRKSYSAQEMYAWYTAWQDGSLMRSLQLEMATPAASARVLAGSAITLNVYAETDNAVGPLDANKRPVALITRWDRLLVPYSGAGDLVITNLQKSGAYTQISLFSAYNNAGAAFDPITAAKIEVDSRIVREVTKNRNDQGLIGREFNKSGLPQDRFDVVFDASDLPTDALVMQAGGQTVRDFRVTATLGTAVAENKLISTISQIYGQAQFE